MTRLALLERLKEVQQLPKYHNRDITTISAMLTMQALERHVQQCEEAAAAWRPPVPPVQGAAAHN